MKQIVKLLTKPYCGLCEEAEFQLSKYAQKYNFNLIKINVEDRENKEFNRKYYFNIPVVLVKDFEFKSRIDYKSLEIELQKLNKN